MVEQHLKMLGLKVKDRVSGVEGVICSVSFDLYGCVQACLNRGMDKDGKPHDLYWYDIARLAVLSNTPVMDRPDFLGDNKQAAGKQGPAEKPQMRQ
jgi:hypothetical protein